MVSEPTHTRISKKNGKELWWWRGRFWLWTEYAKMADWFVDTGGVSVSKVAKVLRTIFYNDGTMDRGEAKIQ